MSVCTNFLDRDGYQCVQWQYQNQEKYTASSRISHSVRKCSSINWSLHTWHVSVSPFTKPKPGLYHWLFIAFQSKLAWYVPTICPKMPLSTNDHRALVLASPSLRIWRPLREGLYDVIVCNESFAYIYMQSWIFEKKGIMTNPLLDRPDPMSEWQVEFPLHLTEITHSSSLIV
jgi:hypothetical protein